MKRLLTSCFGLGFSPFAPGTWGSVPPVIIYMVLAYFIPSMYNALAMILLVIISSFICVCFSQQVIDKTGKKDPSEIVVDETAGQSLPLAAAALLNPAGICSAAAVSFILFRLFDIAKPWPIKKLEKLPGGWGILADDLAAGGIAAIVLILFHTTGFLTYIDGFFACDGGLSIEFAVILGAAQGLTEFLPVSSSGHLVFLEHFMPDINPDSPEMLLFDLSIHVGTLFAILFIYAKSIQRFTNNLIRFRQYGTCPLQIYQKSPSVRILVLAMITTVVTFAMYKVFKDPLESARKLWLVGMMWIITATLLLITDMKKKARLGLRDIGIIHAVIIGLAQTGAIMPGISRSGATICAAILLGLHRRWAIEYSFLIAIPAILGGAVLKFIEEFGNINAETFPIAAVIAGMAASCLVGIAALKILINTSRKRKLKYFAFYCYFLAVFVGLYLLISH